MQEKKYWQSIEELQNDPEIEAKKHNEFPEKLPLGDMLKEEVAGKSASRRDFLKMLGFSTTAAVAAASCEIPVKKAIPYIIKPEEITPGVANYYASTFVDSGDYCSVLVKTREGRPIKIEGNELSPITKGGTSPQAQASVLSLYDTKRLKGPYRSGKESSWDTIDKDMRTALAGSKNIRILSSTLISPSTHQIIKEFSQKYPGTKHITYDPVSYSGMLTANQRVFGKYLLPNYRFNKAEMIVSFSADFLGNWISPLEYATQYVEARKVSPDNPKMARHIQFESNFSLTGANADKRIAIKPSQEGAALLSLYNKLTMVSGGQAAEGGGELKLKGNPIAKAATELWNAKGKALVVCGSNDPDVQELVIKINQLLGSYGSTIDWSAPSYQRQGNDREKAQLAADMNAGNVDTLIIWNLNPAYDYPDAGTFANGLKKVKTTVSFNSHMDETTKLVNFACPDHHYLESWGDAEPKKGHFSLIQPAISPLFQTRQAQESLLTWMSEGTSPAAQADTTKATGTDTTTAVTANVAEQPKADYYSYLKNYWIGRQFAGEEAWMKALQDGVFSGSGSAQTEVTESETAAPAAAGDLNSVIQNISSRSKEGDVELVLYEQSKLGSGKHAINPWLQELPDPISRVSWDNFAAVSFAFAKEKGWEQNDIITISNGKYEIELPVHIQPGLAYGTVAVALGYGRALTDEEGEEIVIGKNAYPFTHFQNGTVSYAVPSVKAEKTGSGYKLARMQTHNSSEGRPIVKDTTFNEYKQDPAAGNKDREKVKELLTTLYPKHPMPGHWWGMAIDLSACIGCGACVVACNAENNIPVVGREEVYRAHEMHWLRIDRYFATPDENNPDEDVETIFQPMLCQHCDNAPCENVCPVAATNHSSEGLNQMAYNRCVGTRYCANNCPYKVRRFNWYDYFGADSFPANEYDPLGMTADLTRMVLNPDVAVRSRGVMEKCTFCVQRIQEGKLNAKKERRKLRDGEIKTACQAACATNAITFGDRNDADSQVRKLIGGEKGENADPRTFFVLEEIHTLPSIGYMTKVRNKEGRKV